MLGVEYDPRCPQTQGGTQVLNQPESSEFKAEMPGTKCTRGRVILCGSQTVMLTHNVDFS